MKKSASANKRLWNCTEMTMINITSRAAVLIPLYKQSMTATEEFSFNNTLSILSKHDLFVICPNRLSGYISKLKQEKQLAFEVEYFSDMFFSDIDGYNNLLMSANFYRRFECYEYMLIVQTDVLVFTDQLEEWCNRNYSYIGAPWFKGLTHPSLPLSFLGVGNGGFSLRKVPDFLMILSSPEYRPPLNGKVSLHLSELFLLIGFIKKMLAFSYSFPPIRLVINEDIFWGVIVPSRCDLFNVSKPKDAISFAFEAAPEYLYELNGYQLPFGCHAWERYNSQFWRDTFKRIGMDVP